jgi:hypothetical protein
VDGRREGLTVAKLERKLQARLQDLYHVDGPPDVAPFVVDEAAASALAPDGARREALFVRTKDGEVQLALHIAASVRAGALSFLGRLRLGRDATHELDPFCAAFEGVAHFVYLTFAGEQGRGVSRLELELQAEIDKYIFLRFVLGVGGPDVLERLYDRVELSATLEPQERERYRVANREARRYARWIDRRCRTGQPREALDDARRTYRQPLPQKLARIAAK